MNRIMVGGGKPPIVTTFARAKALEELGLIQRGSMFWLGHGKETEIREALAKLSVDGGWECDFCLGSPIVSYPVPGLDLPLRSARRGHKSAGAFRACEVCAGLIRADDREGLFERTWACFAEKNPRAQDEEMREEIRGAIQTFCDAFWEFRSGDEEPLTQT